MQQGHWSQEHMTAASECTRPAKMKPARIPTQELPPLAEELLGTNVAEKGSWFSSGMQPLMG